MGKGNAAVKQWLGNPRRFADLFNGIVFQGKQVILPEDLHPATGETDILVSDKNEKAKEVQRYRDIIMRWEQGAYLVLLACENQENVHYAMTVRNMLYDSLSYVEQIRQSWKCLEAAEKQKVAVSEGRQVGSGDHSGVLLSPGRLGWKSGSLWDFKME